jgi:hypothetical protein
MAIFCFSGLASAAATATLPCFTVYGGASAGGSIVRIDMVQSIATSHILAFRKFSTTGTRGSAVTPIQMDSAVSASATANCTGADASTVAPTLVAGVGPIAILPASIGAKEIWTFPASELVIPPGTANGWGFICPSGTGQAFWYSVYVKEP